MKKNLIDDAKYPLRESTVDGLKPHCWDYYDKYDRSKYRSAYTICYGILDKNLNKDFAIAFSKLRSHVKYKKCYVFRKIADMFINNILNNDYLFLYYYKREYAIIDGLLVECRDLIHKNMEIKYPPKKYKILYKFIKYDGPNRDFYIYKDEFYSGYVKYPDLVHNMKYTQVRKLSHDEVLDLKDQMKTLHI